MEGDGDIDGDIVGDIACPGAGDGDGDARLRLRLSEWNSIVHCYSAVIICGAVQ